MLTEEQRKGLEEQIATDTAQIDRLLANLDGPDSGSRLTAIARLEDHIAYCEKKLNE